MVALPLPILAVQSATAFRARHGAAWNRLASGSSLLDLSQWNLSAVQNFLAAHGLTAVDVLMQLLGRYVTDAEELQQGTSAAVTGQ